jgi:hypothetical protein
VDHSVCTVICMCVQWSVELCDDENVDVIVLVAVGVHYIILYTPIYYTYSHTLYELCASHTPFLPTR